MNDSSLIFGSPICIADLLTSCVMFVLFVVMAGIHIPCRREWRQFRMAVHLVGLACLLLSVNYFASIFFEPASVNNAASKLIALVTIGGAAFQALLFTMTSVVLVFPDAVRWHLVARHLALLAAATAACLGCYSLLPQLQEALVVMAGVFYLGYIAYLISFFQRSFKLAVTYLETVYDDDMLPRLRWVRVFFYGALAVGLAALLSAIFPSMVVYTLFNASVPVYYCFAVVCLMNYVITSAYVVKVPSLTEADKPLHTLRPDTPSAEAEELKVQETAATEIDEARLHAVRQALDEWVKARGYAQGDMTVDEIIDLLGVCRQDFMTYFKNVLGTQFRTWRRHLRIEDAMRLIDADPDISISEIIESVGYSDRSNFHKHFQEMAQTSLKEYREAARKRGTDDGNPTPR